MPNKSVLTGILILLLGLYFVNAQSVLAQNFAGILPGPSLPTADIGCSSDSPIPLYGLNNEFMEVLPQSCMDGTKTYALSKYITWPSNWGGLHHEACVKTTNSSTGQVYGDKCEKKTLTAYIACPIVYAAAQTFVDIDGDHWFAYDPDPFWNSIFDSFYNGYTGSSNP